MNPTDEYLLREAVREVLIEHGLIDDVQLEFDLMSAYRKVANPAGSAEGMTNEARQKSILQAMTDGFNKDALITGEWEKLFNTTPNWQTKTNRDFIVWLKERQEQGQTLAKFADWWKSNDFRGKQGAPPTTVQVRELWLQAFTEHKSEGRQGTLISEGI